MTEKKAVKAYRETVQAGFVSICGAAGRVWSPLPQMTALDPSPLRFQRGDADILSTLETLVTLNHANQQSTVISVPVLPC